MKSSRRLQVAHPARVLTDAGNTDAEAYYGDTVVGPALG
jgi:hypothetical protein